MDFARALFQRATSPCRGTFSPVPISTRTRPCGAIPATSVATPTAPSSCKRGILAPPGTNITNKTEDGPWGHCEADYPRKAIVSPYGFKTAQAHYEALLEETKKRAGRTNIRGRIFRPRNGTASTRRRAMTRRGSRTGTGVRTPRFPRSCRYSRRNISSAWSRRSTTSARPSALAVHLLLAGRLHAALLFRSGARTLCAGHARCLPDHRGCCAQFHHTGRMSAATSTWTMWPKAACRAWAPRYRVGTGRPSVSGTRTP